MNRGIGVKTIVDGGGSVGYLDDRYELDSVVRGGPSGLHDLYVIPPTFTIHPDSSEVQQIIITDDDNDAIHDG